MMLAMNGISAVILIVATFATGEAVGLVQFVARHTEVIGHIALLSLAGAVGQIFIFYMVSHFGPLPVSIVTTTRKFFTVMFSVIFFKNALQPHQWVGTALVFGGLFGDVFCNKKPPRHDAEQVATNGTELKEKSAPLAPAESPYSDDEDTKAGNNHAATEQKLLEKV